MPQKRPRPSLSSASKTDLRAPGQNIVMGGRLGRFQNLLSEAVPTPDPVPAITTPRDGKNKKAKPVKPTDNGDTGRMPVNQNLFSVSSLLGEKIGTAARESRRLIQRIGRPRQP
jgi:hypothetical protein